MIILSIKIYLGVSAHALRWNIAGKMKAIGVQKNDPFNPIYAPVLVSRIKVRTTVSSTRRNLVKFLDHYLFLDFGQFE